MATVGATGATVTGGMIFGTSCQVVLFIVHCIIHIRAGVYRKPSADRADVALQPALPIKGMRQPKQKAYRAPINVQGVSSIEKGDHRDAIHVL